jgi:hypothetical protein
VLWYPTQAKVRIEWGTQRMCENRKARLDHNFKHTRYQARLEQE